MVHNTSTPPRPAAAIKQASYLTTQLRKLLALVVVISSFGFAHNALAQALTITDDVITLTTQPTGGTTTTGRNFTGSDNNGLYASSTPLGQSNDQNMPPTPVPQLGTYDLNGNSTLTLTGAQLQGLLGSSQTTITSERLEYRVYLASTAMADIPAYSNMALTSSQTGTGAGNIFSGNTTASINLLTGLTSGGTYIIDVRFAAVASRNGTVKTFFDLSGGDYFYANFYVTPPPTTPAGGTTTWQGVSRGMDTDGNSVTLTTDTQWTNTANWSNGVPTRFSNAIIPSKANSAIVFPILDSPTYTGYAVNNLTLQGNSGSSAAQLVINAATLHVYGNLSQPAGGVSGNVTGSGPTSVGVLNPATNSTIVFEGANQVITGQLLVSDIIIAGSGVKSVINVLIPSNILAFQPASVTNGVIVQSAAQDVSSGTINTVFDTTGNSYIQLVSSGAISTVPGQAETNVSYIKGVTRADRTLTAGVQNTFGNIGIDLTANHTPGSIFVYRVVGDALTGPIASNAVPVKRQYKVVGDDNSESAATATSTIDVVFHYLDSPDELNGIMESNLTMFRSKVNGAPYAALQGTLNTTANTVSRTAVPSLTQVYFTLGDRTNPLPVSLTAFTATRTGTKVALAWTTASEQNNSGFEVQSSSNGTDYHKVAFVASKSPNSQQQQQYSYLDTESGKAGVRYYRLRQLDLDGTESFSPVRTVGFDGNSSLVDGVKAYPNPFTDHVSLSLDATTVGDGTVHVQLVDMTGRIVREQNVAVSNASLTLTALDGLHSGLYIAKVSMPGGGTQTLRVQKQ